MTTETQAQAAPSLDARMAGIEAQQEIIIELLKSYDAKFDAIGARIDKIQQTIVWIAVGVLGVVGAGLVSYIIYHLSAELKPVERRNRSQFLILN